MTKHYYLMTLNEYQSEIFPLVTHIKKMLRKKLFIGGLMPRPCSKGLVFQYMTYDEYIQAKTSTKESLTSEHPHITAEQIKDINDNEQQRAIETLNSHGIKQAKIESDFYHDFTESMAKYRSGLLHDHMEPPLSKTNKDQIRYAMSGNQYIEDIITGKTTLADLEIIAKSVNIKIPQRVYNLQDSAQAFYKRTGVSTASLELIETISDALWPYALPITKDYLENLTKEIAPFAGLESFAGSGFFNALNKKLTPYELHDAYTLATNSKSSADLEIAKQNIADRYIKDMTGKFVFRLQDKLNIAIQKLGLPNIAINRIGIEGTIAECDFALAFINGKIVTGNYRAIIAGGHNIQSAHNRHLMKLMISGKVATQEQLDLIA